MTAEFDAFEDTYVEDLDRAVSFGGKPGEFYTRRKADLLITLAARQLGDPGRLDLLDVGCGIGQTDRFLSGRTGSLTGTDVSPGSLDRARELNPGVRYVISGEDEPLPFADATFDLSFAICVMHHVPSGEWASFAEEMRRVTRPGGIVAIFEHNPWNPGTRKVLRDCVFDEDVTPIRERRMRSILRGAGLEPAESRQIIFLPTSAAWWLRVEDLLRRVPLGAQYYVAARRPA